MKSMNDNNRLEQKHGWSKNNYTILPASLRYETHRIGNSQAFDISFEHIYKTILTDKTSKVEHLFLSIMLMGLGAAIFFQGGNTAFWLPALFIFTGVALVAFYFFGATTYLKVKITDNRYFVLRHNNSDSKQVAKFLEQLFEERDTYLINEYGKINTRLTYNYQLEQFKRLRRLQVWNKRQFKEQCKLLESTHRLLDLGFDIDKRAIQN